MTTYSDMMPRLRLAENGPDDDDLLPSDGMEDLELYSDTGRQRIPPDWSYDDDCDPRELEF